MNKSRIRRKIKKDCSKWYRIRWINYSIIKKTDSLKKMVNHKLINNSNHLWVIAKRHKHKNYQLICHLRCRDQQQLLISWSAWNCRSSRSKKYKNGDIYFNSSRRTWIVTKPIQRQYWVRCIGFCKEAKMICRKRCILSFLLSIIRNR
jgi:hypothetical protein